MNIKRLITISLVAVLGGASYLFTNPEFVLSGTTQINNLMAFGMPAQLASQVDAQYGSAVQASIIPSADNSVDLGSASKQFRSAYVGTSVIFGSTAGLQYPSAAVITPSTSFPTPSAGNTLSNLNTIVAAAAPTAAYVVLPAATAIVGKTYRVYSQSSNPVAIVPQTGAINAAAALTPYACTAGSVCECRGLTTSVIGCGQ